MMKKNAPQPETALLAECREEQPKYQRKPAKKNLKYVVFMPGKNAWPQIQQPVVNDDPELDFNDAHEMDFNDDPEFDSVRLAITDTVFDNTCYAPLLMQRKYFID
jgi:hypothetical protein